MEGPQGKGVWGTHLLCIPGDGVLGLNRSCELTPRKKKLKQKLREHLITGVVKFRDGKNTTQGSHLRCGVYIYKASQTWKKKKKKKCAYVQQGEGYGICKNLYHRTITSQVAAKTSPCDLNHLWDFNFSLRISNVRLPKNR